MRRRLKRAQIKNRELWAQDLETTTEPQGRNALHRIEGRHQGFCCLGRLGEVAIANGVVVQKHTNVLTSNGAVETYDGQIGFLPRAVLKWVGMTHEEELAYSHRNDVRRQSFEEIAVTVREGMEYFTPLYMHILRVFKK